MEIDKYAILSNTYRVTYKKFVYAFGFLFCLIFSYFGYIQKGWFELIFYGLIGGLFFSNSVDFIIRETIQKLRGEKNLGLILGYFLSIFLHILYIRFIDIGADLFFCYRIRLIDDCTDRYQFS